MKSTQHHYTVHHNMYNSPQINIKHSLCIHTDASPVRVASTCMCCTYVVYKPHAPILAEPPLVVCNSSSLQLLMQTMPRTALHCYTRGDCPGAGQECSKAGCHTDGSLVLAAGWRSPVQFVPSCEGVCLQGRYWVSYAMKLQRKRFRTRS